MQERMIIEEDVSALTAKQAWGTFHVFPAVNIVLISKQSQKFQVVVVPSSSRSSRLRGNHEFEGTTILRSVR